MKGYEAVRLARRARQPNGDAIPAGTARVLEALADHVGDNNGLDVWPGEELIAKAVGRARRTVRGHLKLLVNWGLIERRRRGKRGEGGGGREHNVYRLAFLEASNRQKPAGKSPELPADPDRVTGRPAQSNRQTSASNRQYARHEETTEGTIPKETTEETTALVLSSEINLPLPNRNGNDNAAGSPSPRGNGRHVGREGDGGRDGSGDRPDVGESTNGSQPPLLVAVQSKPGAPRAELEAEIGALVEELGEDEAMWQGRTEEERRAVLARLRRKANRNKARALTSSQGT